MNITIHQPHLEQNDARYRPFCTKWHRGLKGRAISFTIGSEFDAEPLDKVAELVFSVTNIGEDAGGGVLGAAIYYRIYDAEKIEPIRSLSVGDAVEIDGKVLACMAMGFEVVE